MSEQPIAVLDQVTKGYILGARKVEVLRGTSLQVWCGDFVTLFGPSGSGKSTLLHLLAGLAEPDTGKVSVCGRDYARIAEEELIALRRQHIGYIFQDFRLLQGLTALENALVPLYSIGVSRRDAKARASHLLDLVGLGERLHHFPRQMSGGEQQRVAIARALTNQPQLILADEPTGNLDEANSAEMMRLLQRLPKETGAAVVAVTHNPAFREYASRVLYLRNGMLEEDAQ